jgi:hypothetical protein
MNGYELEPGSSTVGFGVVDLVLQGAVGFVVRLVLSKMRVNRTRTPNPTPRV